MSCTTHTHLHMSCTTHTHSVYCSLYIVHPHIHAQAHDYPTLNCHLLHGLLFRLLQPIQQAHAHHTPPPVAAALTKTSAAHAQNGSTNTVGVGCVDGDTTLVGVGCVDGDTLPALAQLSVPTGVLLLFCCFSCAAFVCCFSCAAFVVSFSTFSTHIDTR